jgi:hypothetical protein
VFDPDQELIRELVSDASREGGPHEEAWDGKDDKGGIVPNEAYFFTIVAKEPSSGQQVVYDPVTFSGGEQFDLGQATISREEGTLSYKLSQPSRVLVRIRIAKSALLKTLVDWEPRVGGKSPNTGTVKMRTIWSIVESEFFHRHHLFYHARVQHNHGWQFKSLLSCL